MTLHTLLRSAMDRFSCSLVLSSKLSALKSLSITILLLLSLSFPRLSLAQQTSLLWGQQGELWNPQSRLPDFSFAGYHMGEDPIPEVPVVANVKDFGAKGDGVTDDTQAFLSAMSRTSNGALLIPAGKYLITKKLPINRSNFVLRGEGAGNTILYFPKSLADAYGAKFMSNGFSSYSFGEAFLETGWGLSDDLLADVIAPARRGDNTLTVSSATNIKPGEFVRLAMYESGDGSLGRHIHADQYEPKSEEYNYYGGRLVDFASRVISVSGNQITLERPIRTDVQLRWSPEIVSFDASLVEIGIEGITFEFPATAHAGHHYEPGYNAIQLGSVVNSWIRDVTVINSDIAINLNTSWFMTVSDVRFTGRRGHHGIRLNGVRDSLFTDFRIEPVFVHDITVQGLSHGNVFSTGSATDITFDHHKSNAYENLFSAIDTGRGTQLWNTGGNGAQKTGARNTFWNIRKGDGSAAIGASPPWPQINVIGASWSSMTQTREWIEGISPSGLTPHDLYESQLARRLAGLTPPPPSPSIPPPAPSSFVSANPTTVSPPKTVTVTVGNGPGNRTDWVGLYNSSAPTETGDWNHLLKWQYLSGLQTPLSVEKTAAILSFTSPASAGQYQFRFFANDSSKLLASSQDVAVTSPQGVSLINSATMIGHSNNFASDHPVERLWDGCLEGTPASCTAGAGNIASFWIEFDLGKLHDLTSARLFGDADGEWWSTSWTLKYKQNLGDPWSTSFQNANAFFNDWSTQSVPVTARYVRVQVFGNQRKRATQARELEFYGTPR